MEGTVKWFSNKRGYGFIETQEQDVFVHYSEIKTEGYKSLNTGEKVTCDIKQTPKGFQATNVVRLPSEKPSKSRRS